jgi:hypothetical protein
VRRVCANRGGNKARSTKRLPAPTFRQHEARGARSNGVDKVNNWLITSDAERFHFAFTGLGSKQSLNLFDHEIIHHDVRAIDYCPGRS